MLFVLACSTLLFFRIGQTRVAVAHLVGVLVLLTLLLPNVRLRSSSPAAEAGGLVALFINVEAANTDHAAVLAVIRETRPDLIGLAEVNDRWLDNLQEIRDEYPHVLSLPRNDNFGIALFSRLPLEQGSVEFIGSSALPSILARVNTVVGPWQVLVTHPVPPVSRFAFDGRNDQFVGLTRTLADLPDPKLVLGDLNSTLWSPYLRDFRRAAGLRSASTGLRAFHTWPAGMPLLALGLDHCLYSEPAQLAGYRVLSSIGSDHYPILCRLSL